MLIEQAIFTSARTGRRDGYQLVAASPGVTEEDARELAHWGPTHDSLLPSAVAAGSVNFHALPSGAFCASKTTASGAEYSGRRGKRIYTQCLVVPPDVLARFANNPFRLLEAAAASSTLTVHREIPRVLKPFQLVGRSSAVDWELLQRLCGELGPGPLAALVGAAVAGTNVGVTGHPRPERYFAGLINLFPIECRTELSFSTGLRHSQQRPFRQIALPSEPFARRRVVSQAKLAVLNLSDPPHLPSSGWIGLVFRVLTRHQFAVFCEVLGEPRPGLRLADLDPLAEQLRNRFDTFVSPRAGDATCEEEVPIAAATDSPEVGTDAPAGPLERAHAPHRRFAKDRRQADPPIDDCRPSPPSAQLDLQSDRLLERFRALDSVVFDALSGKAEALGQLAQLWPQLIDELDAELVNESREEYLRYALDAWLARARTADARDPQRAIAALDVLSVLFKDR